VAFATEKINSKIVFPKVLKKCKKISEKNFKKRFW